MCLASHRGSESHSRGLQVCGNLNEGIPQGAPRVRPQEILVLNLTQIFIARLGLMFARDAHKPKATHPEYVSAERGRTICGTIFMVATGRWVIWANKLAREVKLNTILVGERASHTGVAGAKHKHSDISF